MADERLFDTLNLKARIHGLGKKGGKFKQNSPVVGSWHSAEGESDYHHLRLLGNNKSLQQYVRICRLLSRLLAFPLALGRAWQGKPRLQVPGAGPRGPRAAADAVIGESCEATGGP